MTLIEILESRKEALNVEEVSELLGVSKQHIYEMVADGSIPAFHVGRSIRFDPQELAGWLQKSKPPTKQGSNGNQKVGYVTKPSGADEVASVHRIWRKRVHHLEVAAASE